MATVSKRWSRLVFLNMCPMDHLHQNLLGYLSTQTSRPHCGPTMLFPFQLPLCYLFPYAEGVEML